MKQHKCILLLFLLFVYAQMFAKTTTAGVSFSCSLIEFEVCHHTAFHDWNSGPPSGLNGQKITEENGLKAVVVANKNDTDADGTIDSADSEVGNELDLVRIRIDIPDGETYDAEDNPLKIEKVGGGEVFIYDNADKTVKLVLPYTYPQGSSFPNSVFLETLEPSEAIDDIVIKVSNKTETTNTELKITSVWVELVGGAPLSSTSSAVPGVDACTLDAIEDSQETHAIGHGLYQGKEVDKGQLAGRILFEWQLLPTTAGELVSMDGSRQKQGNQWFNQQFPWTAEQCTESTLSVGSLPSTDEPTDDSDPPNGCPNNEAQAGGLYYSTDIPGIPLDIEMWDVPIAQYYKMRKTNFNEWVRLAPKGYVFSGQSIQGSRASDKVEWHNGVAAIMSDSQIMNKDENSSSTTGVREGDYWNDPSIDYDLTCVSTKDASSYDYGIYFAWIHEIRPTDGTRQINYFRLEDDCIGEAEYKCIRVYPPAHPLPPGEVFDYEIKFEDHTLHVTEGPNTPSGDMFLNWGSFHSTNKKNEVGPGHFSLNR